MLPVELSLLSYNPERRSIYILHHALGVLNVTCDWPFFLLHYLEIKALDKCNDFIIREFKRSRLSNAIIA